MQLFLLGGYSTRNQAWIHELGDKLAPLADQCVVHDYAHWSNGQEMDFEAELSAIESKARDMKDYVIFAKSIGSILSIEGIGRGLLSPKACVFAGLPLGLVQERGEAFDKQLAGLSCPVTFVQNSNDPLGSFEDIQNYLEQTHPADYSLKELPGDSHSYTDWDELRALVGDSLAAAKKIT